MKYYQPEKRLNSMETSLTKAEAQEVALVVKKKYLLHGMASNSKRHPFYARWIDMKGRCYNKNNDAYKNYGARGIRIEWKSFAQFREDMLGSFTEHYAKHGAINTTIERIDNAKNYSKDNCRWATRKEQNSNYRRNVMVILGNQTKPAYVWAKQFGISNGAFQGRVARGHSHKDALLMKPRNHKLWAAYEKINAFI
jgi:hypothetical protein